MDTLECKDIAIEMEIIPNEEQKVTHSIDTYLSNNMDKSIMYHNQHI